MAVSGMQGESMAGSATGDPSRRVSGFASVGMPFGMATGMSGEQGARPCEPDVQATSVRNEGGWLPLTGTLAIQVAATACTLAFPILAPAIPGTPLAAIGVWLALVYVGAMVGSAAGGALADRFGPVRTSQWSLLLQALALLLLMLPVPMLWLCAALLCGLGYGPITPASSKILARTTKPERVGIVFSVKQTGVPLGGLVAGAVLPVMASHGGWRAALALLVGATCVIALVGGALRRLLDASEPQVARTQESVMTLLLAPVRFVLATPQLRVLALLSLLFSAVQLCVSGYLTVFLNQHANMDLVMAGLVFAVAQGAGMAGRLLWGHLADRLGSSRVVLAVVAMSMAAGALAISRVTGDWSLPLVYVVAIALGATAIGWNGVFLGEVARLAPPGKVATVTGGALFFTYIGVVIGPPLFGVLASHFGSMSLAFACLSVLPAVAALILWGTRRRPLQTA